MIIETAKKVLEIEEAAVRRIRDTLGRDFEAAARLLAECRGRVVTTGMGKSGIICRKVAATLSSTGTPALFMHPAEALHGDLGMIARGDTVLMISNSGETFELLSLLSTLKRLGIPLISMLGDTRSTLARHSDFILDIGVHREACPWGLAPTASSTAALALGDALALTVAVCKGFKPEEFARLHPGGKLGKRLALVEDLMHRGDQLPLVGRETSMPEVIYEMSRKGLGIAVVCEPGRKPKLLGVISDGDLRRLLQKNREGFLDLSAGDCMTSEPEVIMEGEMAVQALDRMEKKKITSLMVVDGKGLLKGVIHLHDLWGTDLF